MGAPWCGFGLLAVSGSCLPLGPCFLQLPCPSCSEPHSVPPRASSPPLLMRGPPLGGPLPLIVASPQFCPPVMSSSDATVLARPFQSQIGDPRQLSSAPGIAELLFGIRGLGLARWPRSHHGVRARAARAGGSSSWLLVGNVS